MIIALAVRVTGLLIIGCIALACLPRKAAVLRHAVCVLTITVSLLLPFLLKAPVIPSRFVFTVSAATLEQVAGTRTYSLITPVWLIGVAVVLLRFGIGVAFLSWKTRRARNQGEVRIAQVDSPVVWGWFNPVILMPAAAERWTREQWSIALAHERAHLERGDIWTSTLAVFAEALYWFHPLMWWMTRRMREEQELACDEKVLEQGRDGIAYAELLMETAGLPESRLLGCRMTGGKMKERMQRILQWQSRAPQSRAKRWSVVVACTLCLALGAVIAPAASDEPYKIGGDVSAPKLIFKLEPKYTKAARDAKIEGIAVFQIVISAEGIPGDVQVVKSLDSGLDKEGIKAILQWRFEPATKDGKPVAVQADVEVNFRLM